MWLVPLGPHHRYVRHGSWLVGGWGDLPDSGKTNPQRLLPLCVDLRMLGGLLADGQACRAVNSLGRHREVFLSLEAC